MNWFRNKFKAHTLAFTLMVLTSIGLYLATHSHSTSLIWGLMGGFAAANVLAIFVR